RSQEIESVARFVAAGIKEAHGTTSLTGTEFRGGSGGSGAPSSRDRPSATTTSQIPNKTTKSSTRPRGTRFAARHQYREEAARTRVLSLLHGNAAPTPSSVPRGSCVVLQGVRTRVVGRLPPMGRRGGAPRRSTFRLAAECRASGGHAGSVAVV